jgi:hypothetical protein
MTALNTQVQVQSRSGAIVGPAVSISAFWSAVDATAEPFDPHVVYDAAGGRWIFTASGNVQSSSSEILVAVSQTSDPTGNWSKWKFKTDPTGTNWADYDQVGFNRDWIVVTMNLYGVSSGNFAESQLFVFQKSLLYAGAANPSPSVFTTPNFSLAPAKTYDPIDVLYTLASVSPNTLQIQSISGPVTAPAFNPETDVTAPLSWDPQGANGADFAPQKGTIQKIDAGDDRIMSLVVRGGNLWAAQTVFLPAGGPTRSACQWWQLTPGGTILQHGLVDDPTATVFYAYPSLSVNAAQDACMGYNAFSATTFASAHYAARCAQDAPGTMRADALLEAGKATYFKTDGVNNRWGDFSSTQVDPMNDTDFWTLQEYAELPQSGMDAWGTWWGQVLMPVLPSAFVPSSLGAGFTGVFATTTFSATGTPPIFWSTGPGAPPGMTMNLAGIYSGTPTATGTYTFNVTAANTAGSTTVPYTQAINVLAPTITSPLALDDGFAGVATSTQFQATGSPPITWSVSAGTLPPGIVFDVSGLYSGTPTVAGVYTFSITAANTGGSDTLAYVQQIGPLPPTIIAPLSLQADVEGVTTSTQFQAYGTKPLAWSVTSGSLPPGIAFTASGLYSGTPTATGSYTFQISATNIYGVDSLTYTQTVLPPTPPTITGPPSPITTATVGVPFSVSFTASGDPPPTWSIQAGAVPSGLVLATDGVLSGTPTVAGVFTFTVAATNIAATDTAAYTQTVVAPPPPPPVSNTLQVTIFGSGAAAPPGTAGVLALALFLQAGPSEDVQVTGIDLSTTGLPASSAVTSVHLVLDANGDRTLDSGDTTLATTSFDGFGGATLSFSLTVKAGTLAAVFITYDLAAQAPPGALGTTIPVGGVTATGVTTGLPAQISSLPISGSTQIEASAPPPSPPPTFSGGGGGGGGGGCAIEPRSGSAAAFVPWLLVALLVLRRRQG